MIARGTIALPLCCFEEVVRAGSSCLKLTALWPLFGHWAMASCGLDLAERENPAARRDWRRARCPGIPQKTLAERSARTRFRHPGAETVAGIRAGSVRRNRARRIKSFPELGAAEPSLRAAPGVGDFPDQPILLDRPSFARRMLRGLVRFCIVFLIGVAATLTWQSEGDQAVELVRTAAATWGPAWTLDWLPSARAPLPGASSSASSTNPPPVAQAMAKPETALPQSAPAAQMSAAQMPAAQTPAAAATPPKSARLIETMARDLTGVRHSIEQLTAREEDMAQSIATLQAAEQELKQKIASLPRPAPRHKPPPHAPASPGAQSSALPPQSATSSAVQSPSAPSALPPPRPPAPLH